MQIATEHSETVGESPRVRVEKGLLFDGIALHSGNITPGNVESATAVESNFAHTGLAIGNRAAVAAGVAAHPIIIQLVP